VSATPPVFRSRWLDAAEPSPEGKSLVPAPTELTKTLSVGFVGSTPSRFQSERLPLAAPEREAGDVIQLDATELLRRRVARRGRTLADLAGRYCSACGFSCWAVTDRGDASCYGCRLLARGITPRCARCKRQEWRVESGRRVCRYCEAIVRARGDTNGQGATEIARLGATSQEVSDQGGRP
jgi:hypothetical protein